MVWGRLVFTFSDWPNPFSPVFCLLGRWNSIELYCPSHFALSSVFWGLWGRAISKGEFKYLQVLLKKSQHIRGAEMGDEPNV